MESEVSSSSLVVDCAAPAPELQRIAREQFKSRIFLGRYVDRRLVSDAVGYRDLVLVSPAEWELQRDLLELRRRLAARYPPAHWLGITDTSLLAEYKPGVCVWAEIDDQPFGAFWFQIRAVEFRADEVALRLRCVRHLSERFLELEPMLLGGGRGRDAASPHSASTDETTIASVVRDAKELLVRMRTAFTFNNIKDLIVFVFALLIATLTGSVALVRYLGTFTLSLTRELSILIKNSTPLFLGFLDFISKIIGGFYILLAMFFRQTSPAPRHSRQVARYSSRGSSAGRASDYDSSDYHPKYFD